ncbi:MAG: AI-2E family transporter [Chlorobi bacterium]|nr:AI-2E family transporter [Chlorobiota bacterium]
MNESNKNLNNSSLQTVFYSFSIIALSILLLIYFENILKPFVFALMIWYIIKELKRVMGKIKIKGKSIPKWLTGLLSFFVIVLVLFGIFQMISVNIEQFNDVAPQYREKTEGMVSQMSDFFKNPKIMDYVQQSVAKINIAAIATNIVNSLSNFFTVFMVILIYVIFMLLEEAAAFIKIDRLFPEKNTKYKRFVDLIDKVDKSVRAYMFSMIFISFLTAVVSYIALLIMGIDFPVLWAFLIFILNFIPYIGPFISSLLPALLAVFQFGNLINFVYVFVVLEIIQIILGNFVQPKMMGKSLNISPLTVLVSLAFWSSIWGIVGMILAIPITSIFIIILAQFPGSKTVAILLSENGEVGE